MKQTVFRGLKKEHFLLTFMIALFLVLCVGCNSLNKAVKESVPAEKMRLLGFGAVLATRNSMDNKLLSGGHEAFKEKIKVTLDTTWGIVDRTTAIEILDWLKEEGSRISLDPNYDGYDDVFDIICSRVPASDSTLLEYEAEINAVLAVGLALMDHYEYTEDEINSIATVSAWDYDRLVNIARWCFGCEYITQDEAWAYIEFAAAEGKKDYADWRTYFAGVMFGRAIWSGSEVFEDTDIADKLLLDKNSIYSTNEF